MRRAALLVWGALACGGPAQPARHAPAAAPATARAELDDAWQPLSYGAYLAPTELDGRVDVIFHFHAGRAAEPEYRAAGLRAVVATFQLSGLGTTPYWDAMNDPNRFESMKAELARSLCARAGHDVALGRVALVAWSAGYASVQRVLAQPRHYDEIDALVLLDALHSGWASGGGAKRADLAVLSPFVRFAKDAAAGRKLFVFTHSSIVPEGYASTREVADALAAELGARWTAAPQPDLPGAERGADAGNAHLRGWAGAAAKDHVLHDHLVGAIIRTWLGPRWAR